MTAEEVRMAPVGARTMKVETPAGARAETAKGAVCKKAGRLELSALMVRGSAVV